MKNKYITSLLSFLIFASFILTGCQPLSGNPIETVAPSETDILPYQITSTTSPAHTPEIPTPTADLLTVKTGIDIDLTDLPSGFIQVPRDMLYVTPEQLSGKGFSNKNPFLFFNAKTEQLITGFTTLLDTEADKASFDDLIAKPDRAIKAFSDFYGATQITGEPKIQGIDTLGDAASNMRITMEVALTSNYSLSHNVTLVVFRSKNLGIYIVEMYNAEINTASIFPDYANQLDTKIESLSVTSTLTSPTALSPEQSVSWIDPGAWLLLEEYEKKSVEDIGISQTEWGSAGFNYDALYLYESMDGMKTIIGLNTLLETYEEIGKFDIQSDTKSLNHGDQEFDVMLKQLVVMTGAENLEENTRMYNTQKNDRQNVFNKSDAIVGRTVVAELDGVPYQFELLASRKGNIKILLFTFQPVEFLKKPNVLSTQYLAGQINLLVEATELFRKRDVVGLTSESVDAGMPAVLPAGTLPPLSGSDGIDFARILPDFIYPPVELLSTTTEQLSGQSFINERLFYLTGRNQQVLGFTVQLDTEENSKNFNAIIAAPNDALTNMLDFYEASNSEVNKGKKVFVNLGDVQVYANMNFFSPNMSKGGRMEMLAFSKDGTGFYFLTIYSAFYEGVSIFPDFANSLVRSVNEQALLLTPTPLSSSQSVYFPPESSNPLIAWAEPGRSFLSLGYERVSLEDIKISSEEWDDIGLDYDTLFIYKHSDGPKVILGYNILLETFDEVGKFDMAIQEIDPLLEKLAMAVGATSIREQESKEGDSFNFTSCDKWRSLSGDISGVPYRFQLVKTRQENIGFLIFTIEPPESDDPNTSYNFTSDACNKTIWPLIATRNFRIDFPIRSMP